MDKLTKIALVASFMLALTFTFGCSDNDKGNSEPPSTDGNSLSYQGKTYKTVKIGSQVWMAENLNYDVSGSKCYGKKEINCSIYGRLYDWATAKTVCPSGWHLPKNADWDKLCRYVDSTSGKETPYESQTAGEYLKSKSGWTDLKGNSAGNGTDEFGFSALPGGFGTSDNAFYGLNNFGSWWSASEYEDDSDYAYSRYIYYSYNSVDYNHDDKQLSLLSVRCVKD